MLRLGEVFSKNSKSALKDARKKSFSWNRKNVVETVKQIKSGENRGAYAVYGHKRERK